MGGERAGHAGMMENFSALFGGAEPPAPAAATALGFGPGKPGGPGAGPPPAAATPQTAEDAARKAAAASGPFYLMRELPGNMELTGSTNLITHYNLEHSYNKFCGKKVKEKLSNFLPDLPGMIDLPGSHDNSSLRSLIEKPPICSSSFNPITGTMLTGFRLHAGPLPEQCRLMHIQPPKKKNKHKHKQSRTQDPVPPDLWLSLQKPPQTPTTRRRRRKRRRIRSGRGRRKRRRKRRTGTAQSTQAWAAPKPAAAAASGEALNLTVALGSLQGDTHHRLAERWGERRWRRH
ncbi:mediator of RNA polymerase II transcription subunit 19 isoform X2 [Dermochelys coriacea]|uniref:mediator of RNA polymerase II transcription subunit 19 isoform X2 n=1 Tax=Dermochelys coriacea TaxID=27794 RepID=UPI001CA8BF69|nr:mediator of RNA polymerase II transcription subunit 19 isoform X2 [Dermochelys coriacea]